MKRFGLLLIIVGLAVAIFVGYLFLREQNRIISPLPEESGVKVIYVTPTPSD